MLDDLSLAKMIRDIAQVICDAYWLEEAIESHQPVPPLKFNKKFIWARWVRECVANYSYLVTLGVACDWEAAYRKDFKLDKKYHDIFEWARKNTPDLPLRCHSCVICHKETSDGCNYCQEKSILPLIMPKKYILDEDELNETNIQIIGSYRNYYQAKLKQKFQYSNAIVECHSVTGAEIVGNGIEVRWTKRQKPEWISL